LYLLRELVGVLAEACCGQNILGDAETTAWIMKPKLSILRKNWLHE
jgi:hypothetical protein